MVDSDMQDVAHDGKATGEIVARAPWLTMGYLNDPKASERLWAGGYLHTGDIGSIDPDGTVHITDRSEGHHQKRRRVDLLDRPGGHHPAEGRCGESRCDRRA